MGRINFHVGNHFSTQHEGGFWTAIWIEQLRIIGGNYAPFGTHVKAADSFHEWIREQLRQNRPMNEFVAEMVSASGSNLQNGPSTGL